jgi:hypothetical protein
MASINMKRLCADALADLIATKITGLAGKISTFASGPETQANCLALRILPEMFSFEESEPDEVYFATQDDGKVVVSIGLFSGLFSIQLYTTSPAERELYEQKILDVFLAGEWAPGTLFLTLPNLTVNGYASLYSDECTVYLQTDTWNDELAFESRRMSFIEVAVDYPALTTYDAPTITSLQLAFADDLDSQILTVQDVDSEDRVEIQQDGSTIPATV